MKRNFKELLANVKALVFDVDGVFTDGGIEIDAAGNILRRYNVKDGLAVVRAVKKGYPIAIISGGKGDQLKRRMEILGIDHIYLGALDKMDPLREFSHIVGVPLEELLYVGDDYPDLAPMRAVGLSIAPSDAADEVRAAADYVSSFRGGHGVVRDAVEQVLRAHGDWFSVDETTIAAL